MQDSTQPPTLLALLRQRIDQSPEWDTRSSFESTLLLFEAAIKMITASALSKLREFDGRSSDMITAILAREDTLGTWVNQLNKLTSKLHRSGAEDPKSLARWLTVRQKDSPQSQLTNNIRNVVELLGDPDYHKSPRPEAKLLDGLHDLVFLRNRTRGHGAQTGNFFDQAAPAMILCVDEFLRIWPENLSWWTTLTPTTDKGGQLLFLGGPAPDQIIDRSGPIGERGALWTGTSPSDITRIGGLVEYDVDSNTTWLINGGWNPQTGSARFLDYRTGTSKSLLRPQISTFTEPPESETAGLADFLWTDNCAHNLPPRPSGYIKRHEEESFVSQLLLDKVHRVITLQGPGGIGKTSLALQALWDMVEHESGPGFDVIIWFSGRDIDLIQEGPQPRSRQVTGLEGVATLMFRLMNNKDPAADEEAISYFQAQVSGQQPSSAKFLLVMDNFETFNDPIDVQKFLDSNVVPPNKVFITSRHEAFQGDYPVRISGMRDIEAEELLDREGIVNFCEGRLTKRIRDQIKSKTGRSPYLMKLAVSHIATGMPVSDLTDQILSRDDILEALFERSFESLGEDAVLAFLILGQVTGPVPVPFLSSLEELRESNVISELLRFSLATIDESSHEIALVPAARPFSQRVIEAHTQNFIARDIARDVQAFVSGGSGLDASFKSLIYRIATGSPGPERDRLITYAQSISEEAPWLWAEFADSLAKSEQWLLANSAFEKASWHDPSTAQIWIGWAEVAKNSGDHEQSLFFRIRAVECPDISLSMASDVANDLNTYVSYRKNEIEPRRRTVLSESVIKTLEDFRVSGRLNATDLSRLGWLYLNQYAPESDPEQHLVDTARQCALEGLRLQPENQFCKNLLSREPT